MTVTGFQPSAIFFNVLIAIEISIVEPQEYDAISTNQYSVSRCALPTPMGSDWLQFVYSVDQRAPRRPEKQPMLF